MRCAGVPELVVNLYCLDRLIELFMPQLFSHFKEQVCFVLVASITVVLCWVSMFAKRVSVTLLPSKDFASPCQRGFVLLALFLKNGVCVVSGHFCCALACINRLAVFIASILVSCNLFVSFVLRLPS